MALLADINNKTAPPSFVDGSPPLLVLILVFGALSRGSFFSRWSMVNGTHFCLRIIACASREFPAREEWFSTAKGNSRR
jgi:hypothetical protein